jgi:hypothetical protein
MRLSLVAPAALFVLALAACSGGGTPTNTTSPTVAATALPETTAVTELDSPTPTTTPWVPPPPVTNRPGEPRVAPDALHPSVGLREDGVPLEAQGTLAVYGKELRGAPNLEVVVFDLERQERISSFELEANLSFSVQLAGNRVIASFGKQIWSYALDGSEARLLNEELSFSYMRPSPDGSHLAVTGSNEEHPTSIGLIDVASGDLLQLLNLQVEAPGWQGEPHPARWLSESEVLVGGLCNCDVPVEGYFPVSVALDGTVTRDPSNVPPDRASEVQITDAFDPSCSGFASGRTVQLVDTATSEMLARASEDAPIFFASEIAPDGSEALILSLVPDDDLRTRLNEALAAGECVEWSVSTVPVGLAVLRAGEDRLEPAASRLEVLERWYGDQLPVFRCGDEERAAVVTSNWLSGPTPWRDAARSGQPWGFSSDDCQQGRELLEMWIGNTLVDTDGEGYRVLGLLDPSGTPAEN